MTPNVIMLYSLITRSATVMCWVFVSVLPDNGMETSYYKNLAYSLDFFLTSSYKLNYLICIFVTYLPPCFLSVLSLPSA